MTGVLTRHGPARDERDGSVLRCALRKRASVFSTSIGSWSERTLVEVATERVHARARHAIKIGGASDVLLAAAAAFVLKSFEPRLTGQVDDGTFFRAIGDVISVAVSRVTCLFVWNAIDSRAAEAFARALP
jgi:hypothetical protein